MENTFKNICSNIFVIDLNTGEEERSRRIADDNPDLFEFLQSSIDSIDKVTSKREFTFESEEVELKTLIKELLDNNGNDSVMDEVSRKISGKYRRAIHEVIKNYGHLKNTDSLTKTNLLVSFFEKEGKRSLIVSSLRDGQFLEKKSWKREEGIYFDDNVLKLCLFKFNSADPTDHSIYVADKSSKQISEYWFKDFLDLRELHTNEKNTKDAFRYYETYIGNKIKPKAPHDAILMRNNVVGYFKTHEVFSVDEFTENVVGNYTPESKDINIHSVRSDFMTLPEVRKFDTHFEIKNDVIKSKFKKTYTIHENIDLSIKGNIDNLRDIIQAKEMNGRKGIMIFSDEAYNLFKGNK
jgi:hypothetical protein